MAAPPRHARDLALMDALDACSREAFIGDVWRVTRNGRDPTLGSATLSRWCDGTFDVLYTSQERDGAIAEVHALLTLQPVFPSKIVSLLYRLQVKTSQTLHLVDLDMLAALGVDAARYRERDYSRTSAIAEAAHFLGFDGLIAPSARYKCANLVLFCDRIAPDDILPSPAGGEIIDWTSWRTARRS